MLNRGILFCGNPVIREVDIGSKYGVPRYIHAPPFFFGYMSGGAYLLRAYLIPNILQASLTTPIMHVGDAYINGLLTRKIGVKHYNSPFFTYIRTKPDACLLKTVVRRTLEI
jgi:hypothetical protein